ncbi:hypothetical protein JYU34_006186 [Plutella xylostella]|uniref:Uncharacterized protein n=1 Tax=Plutella xylostella TaxID=51655 RepID=A0ABQ7QV50_PLUXY|nr:hypothetical protein JYU34_006186 [Plutella xylostella]
MNESEESQAAVTLLTPRLGQADAPPPPARKLLTRRPRPAPPRCTSFRVPRATLVSLGTRGCRSVPPPPPPRCRYVHAGRANTRREAIDRSLPAPPAPRHYVEQEFSSQNVGSVKIEAAEIGRFSFIATPFAGGNLDSRVAVEVDDRETRFVKQSLRQLDTKLSK